MASPLIQIILDIINSQPTNCLQIDWHVPITLRKIVQGLVLILLSGTQGSQPGQQTAIRISLTRQNLVPFHRLFRIPHQLVDISDLINDFGHMRDYRLKFLKSLERFYKHV